MFIFNIFFLLVFPLAQAKVNLFLLGPFHWLKTFFSFQCQCQWHRCDMHSGHRHRCDLHSGVIDTAVTLDLIVEWLWLPLKGISIGKTFIGKLSCTIPITFTHKIWRLTRDRFLSQRCQWHRCDENSKQYSKRL
jgi:hypothetical protein